MDADYIKKSCLHVTKQGAFILPAMQPQRPSTPEPEMTCHVANTSARLQRQQTWTLKYRDGDDTASFTAFFVDAAVTYEYV